MYHLGNGGELSIKQEKFLKVFWKLRCPFYVGYTFDSLTGIVCLGHKKILMSGDPKPHLSVVFTWTLKIWKFVFRLNLLSSATHEASFTFSIFLGHLILEIQNVALTVVIGPSALPEDPMNPERQFVYLSVSKVFFYGLAHYIFLVFCMKLGFHKWRSPFLKVQSCKLKKHW